MTAEFMDYKVKYDYHTHTVHSHGKGSISDNVRIAVEKGLSGIAVSEHGPGHWFYGINRESVRKMRMEI
jgi:putative hydrolase